MKQTAILSLLSILILSACSVETDFKQQTANQIARPAFMVERTINTGDFTLDAWERMHQRGETATLYIEGDSINQVDTNASLIGRNLARINPTPNMPLALLLASRDKSTNLAYLTRPCQYVKMPEEKGCDTSYWQENRFTPEVVEAYVTAMDDMKARYGLTGFHVVGYDGGANIAAILAAKRADIVSLRTVAGNLNPDLTNDKTNHKTLASNSLMAIDHASQLVNVPQHHFIGAADPVITPGVYHSYRQMLGLSDCISYSLIPDADHTKGWVEKWPELLEITPKCEVAYQEPIDSDYTPPIPDMDQKFPNQNLNKGMSK